MVAWPDGAGSALDGGRGYQGKRFLGNDIVSFWETLWVGWVSLGDFCCLLGNIV
jgi:hypothetical protein